MTMHPLAGKPAPDDMLVNIPRLMTAYFTGQPDPEDPAQQVSFGTSGHRGCSLANSFNQAHILAITQALCDYRKEKKTSGPLFLGMDTHALSEAALATAVEVLAANKVDVLYQEGLGYTPTPVISHAILTYNLGRSSGLADGVVITPSHNPPDNGGFKYNPPEGGPADTDVTRVIQDRANAYLAKGLQGVKRIPYARAMHADTVKPYDYIRPYVKSLDRVLDMRAIRAGELKLGADPMGGSGLDFWDAIAEHYGLDLTVVNRKIDPAFMFMSLDKDGKIRMDCSSPYAMASLIALKEEYDIAFGNDPDFDRHGIVTKSGLMNPNHYLAACVWYLFQNRPDWPKEAQVGKTLVSSSIIDRVAAHLGRKVYEVPVGFKWFVPGLLSGEQGIGLEESAGASFLRRSGNVWTTDKDGIILNLLAAEIMVKTGKDPSELYADLTEMFGSPLYERLQAPANAEQKKVLKGLTPEMVTADTLAGEAILAKQTRAPGNDAPLGGLKVTTENGWFAARPSGTEDIYKIYTESFKGPDHLKQIQDQAQEIVSDALKSAGA